MVVSPRPWTSSRSKVGFVVGLGLSLLAAAGPTEAQPLAPAPFVYYVPASARAAGAFGSFWVSDLLLRSPGPVGTTANVTVIAHPRGSVASGADPAIAPFAVPGGSSVDLLDVLGRVRYADGTGFGGAAWLEVRSDLPLTIESAPTYNLAGTGERTGSALPVFDAGALSTNQRLAREGDVIEYRLMGPLQGFRENDITFVPPESADVRLLYEHLDRLGNRKAFVSRDVPAASYAQDALESISQASVEPGDTLRKTILRAGADRAKEVWAYTFVSQIQTLNPQFQDWVALEGTKYPIAHVVFASPLDGEQNDSATFSARIDVPGGYAVAAWFNERGLAGHQDHGVDNPTRANPLALRHATVLPAAGTYTPVLHLQVRVGDGPLVEREYKGATYTVTPENDHVLGTEAIPLTKANTERLASLLSAFNVSYTANAWPEHVSRTDALALLNGMTDGQPAPYVDMTSVTIRDTVEHNPLIFTLANGLAQSFAGFTEAQTDELRQIYGRK